MWQDYFPDSYDRRPSQVRFVEKASKILSNKDVYMVCAPCGVGKSLATLMSALPLVDEGKKLIIAYRTRSQISIYLKELKAVSAKCSRNYLAVSVFSKRDMCPRFYGELIGYHDFLEACRRLRKNTRKKKEPICDHFNNVLQDPDHAYGFAKECCLKYLSPLKLSERGRKENICPYEALKLVFPEAEIFLGTYHYLLEPTILRQVLHQLETDLSETIVVIDEAHNLPSFARDILSDRLPQTTVAGAINETREFDGLNATEVNEMLETLEKEVFNRFGEKLADGLRRIDPFLVGKILAEGVGRSPKTIAEKIHEYGEYVWDVRFKQEAERIYSYAHRTGEFLSAFFNATGPQYTHWVLHDYRGRICLELRNLDGRELTDRILERGHSAILMSGTLTPIEIYRDLVSRKSNRILPETFESPFPAKNRLIAVARDVSSRLEERTNQTFNRWTEYVQQILKTNKGNVAVFFTSYELMRSVLPRIKTKRNTIVERRRTTRKEVMDKLSSSTENVLFGVLGGKFAEGIDYPGKTLTCVASVGFPYADWNKYQQTLVEYMDGQFPGKGRLYSYLTPAILRLLQACGRVHRSGKDVGCIIVLDKRVFYPYIRKHLPQYFQKEMQIVSNPAECKKLIQSFWRTI